MVAVCVVEWLLLCGAPRVSAKLGPPGIEVMTRMSGFLLIRVGMQFIASGIRTRVTDGRPIERSRTQVGFRNQIGQSPKARVFFLAGNAHRVF